MQIAGIHHQPYGEWMEQMARNLTDAVEGFLRGALSTWVPLCQSRPMKADAPSYRANRDGSAIAIPSKG